MERFRSKNTVQIKGPIGMGTPFKMAHNSDGSPNYVLSIKHQQQIANQRIPNSVSKVDPKTLDRGEGSVSNYVSNLRSKIANIQQLKQEQNERLAKVQPKNAPSGIVSNLRIVRTAEINKSYVQKSFTKPSVKNAPTIKR